MTYVSVVTIIAYVLLMAGLAAVSVTDWKTRRIPNGAVLLLALLWVVWRCVLGFAGRYMGLGFWNTLLAPAPSVLNFTGFPIEGVSLSEGVLGALVLGGGMLVLSAVYELITKKESLGGGDIKLMVVIGLFLGWERGLICLLAACALSVVYMLVTRGRHVPAGEGVAVADPFLARTMPFGPFLAIGTLAALFS